MISMHTVGFDWGWITPFAGSGPLAGVTQDAGDAVSQYAAQTGTDFVTQQRQAATADVQSTINARANVAQQKLDAQAALAQAKLDQTTKIVETVALVVGGVVVLGVGYWMLKK